MEIILEHLGINTKRIALEWVSAAEAPLFVEKISSFTSRIRELGPLGKSEGLDRRILLRKIKAARISLEGMKIRMAFARQAKQVKKEGSYGELPDAEKLRSSLESEMTMHETFLCLKEKKQSVSELASLLDLSEERIDSVIEKLQKKKMINADLTIT